MTKVPQWLLCLNAFLNEAQASYLVVFAEPPSADVGASRSANGKDIEATALRL